VIVGEDGTFAGTISASQVLAKIEDRAAAIRRDAVESVAAREAAE
jgi:hypothetical protein